MPPAFFARITPAGYDQFPDLMVVVPLEGFSPGSAPPRPTPQPPLGIWGPTDPRPTQPIYLPDPIPPDLPQRPGIILPPAGSPGSPSNPLPPGEVPPHAATGIQKFYVLLPGVGVVGPYYVGPGVPPAVPA